MKITFITVILCLTTVPSFSQQTPSAQSLYVEFLSVTGTSVFSLNYDRRFHEEDGIGFHLGAGAFPEDNSTTFVLPLGLNYISTRGAPNYFEAGLGVTVLTAAEKGASAVFVPTVGYRYQPLGNGFTFRAVFSPWIAGGDLLFAGGLSVGYKF